MPPSSSTRIHPQAPPRKRLSILLISFALFIFHLVLSSKFSQFSNSLVNVLDDNDDDGDNNNSLRAGAGGELGHLGSLYGVVTLLGIARLWSLCSAFIALIGIYSIYKSNLSLLRLFTLNTFLSIALDLFLLLLSLLLLSFTSSSGHSISTTLCQTLSNQNNPHQSVSSWSWTLPDLLGLSLEQCEEKFQDGVVLTSLLVAITLVEGVRGVCGIKLLGYYTGLAKGATKGGGRRGGGGEYETVPMMDGSIPRRGSGSSSRRGSLRVDITGIGSREGGNGRYHDSPEEDEGGGEISLGKTKSRTREHSGSGSSKRGNNREDQRILVLPRAVETRAEEEGETELLDLKPTTNSGRTSFPPHPSTTTKGSEERKKILVYQPVMMTIEEARHFGASEVQLSSSSKPSPCRTRSLSHQNNPPPHQSPRSPSKSRSDRRSRSSTITPSSLVKPSPSSSSRGNPLTLNTSNRSVSAPHPVPPPPPSPSPSTASSSRTARQDSEELLTPKGDESGMGFAGILLRGEFEVDSLALAKGDKKRA
ncbi:uncharacterized protein JCM6883_005247 [Sporobolomyces salmoneus]|uniref:uncharacterized protein n=1 Tax=Sporobolomyces salmoneus TaxID=183962 RepID=UPI003175A996